MIVEFARYALRFGVLAAIGYALFAEGAAGWHGLAALAFLGYCLTALGWLATALLSRAPRLVRLGAFTVWLLGALFMVPGTLQSALGLIMVCLAVLSAAGELPRHHSLGLTVCALLAVGLLYGFLVLPVQGLLWPLTVAGAYFAGLQRRHRKERLEQAELLLAETQVAKERARIAREMHDVLAHSLGGLVVQLEAASALLEDVPDGERARDCVRRARGLATDGLAETRRAVSALRAEPGSLTATLTELTEGYAGPVELELPERPVHGRPEVVLALARVATEAVTNVTKHARGARLRVRLERADGQLRMVVANGPGEPEVDADGGGYGVLGMRERMERVGGSLSAGPDDEVWSVVASVPDE